MKKFLPIILFLLVLGKAKAQSCMVTTSVRKDTIVCGQSTFLSANGSANGNILLFENFDNANLSSGWSATNQVMWNNPCSANGIDSSTHIWMGNSASVPRIITTPDFDLSGCGSVSATLCFDLLFAVQGDNAPCEGPDEPQEGVYVQYFVANDTGWHTIFYFNPNGGNDPQLTNWHNWCFEIPISAVSANTKFRWYQNSDSGADFDHWGIDNVELYCNDSSFSIIWQHDGYNEAGINPNAVSPHTTTDYIVTMSDGTVICSDTITVFVQNPTLLLNAGSDTVACNGGCITLQANAKVIQSPAKTPIYRNNEVSAVSSTPGFPGFPPTIPPTPGLAYVSMDINVTGLNLPLIQNDYITSVCIDSVSMTLFAGVEIFDIWLVCPSGDSILLVKDSTVTGNFLTGTCFVPASGNIVTASSPYTGNYSPNQSFNDLTGCSANGVWSLRFWALVNGFSLPTGTLHSWSMSFNDPEVTMPGNILWASVSNITNIHSLTPTVCPSANSTYIVTLTDTAGCASITDTIDVSTQICTGINSQVKEAINVYPNPISGKRIIVECTVEQIGNTIEIVNVQGQLVYNHVIQKQKFEIELDLPRGVYLFQIRTNQIDFTKKLIRL